MTPFLTEIAEFATAALMLTMMLPFLKNHIGWLIGHTAKLAEAK